MEILPLEGTPLVLPEMADSDNLPIPGMQDFSKGFGIGGIGNSMLNELDNGLV